MATIQKAIKVGSSVAAVLPKALLKETGIIAGTSISVESVDGAVLIRPVGGKDRRVKSDDERVAETALGLINRYQDALRRLADA
jgi:antitoxin component of MazEF toxin-antitoxin module